MKWPWDDTSCTSTCHFLMELCQDVVFLPLIDLELLPRKLRLYSFLILLKDIPQKMSRIYVYTNILISGCLLFPSTGADQCF